MRYPHNPRKIRAFLVFVLVWTALFWTAIAHAEPASGPTHRLGTVAIDPGHGGQYTGASGTTGLLEKTVTLALARQLALDLEPDYHVVLTRSDDYHVDLHQRAAIANHAKADIIISLHTGAGFRHATRGRAIYFHAIQGDDAKAPLRENGAAPKHPWHHVQNKHLQASQTLAKLFKLQFGKMPGTIPCHLQGAPLVVLYGADMPAVLIEVGHISHPDTEKYFTTTEGTAQLVKALRQGIDEFFRQRVQ